MPKDNNKVKSKNKKSIGARNKERGNNYERKIVKELQELGFSEVITSRKESKSTDDGKIDIIDKANKLPCFIQLKRTISTPSYFTIRRESIAPKDKFCIIWNKQKKVGDRFMSDGEVVMLPKELFYELIRPYSEDIKNKNNESRSSSNI